ncbi:cystathionine gamma-synthase [Rhodovibrio sodomensis]|uniref:Cystathionine gamma-synthase n=2 Tax=Rhodovibrio sodomensis TaxID=1088 RepID=A0ABS1DB69_9PROT|nr:cystathionine gamma-synthase [Rhodovibrio sodomensis]
MAPHPATLAAQTLEGVDPQDGAIVPDVKPATTYARDSDNQLIGDAVYARDQSPSVRPAERLLAELEGGEAALLFASGMAGAAAVFQALRPGDHVIAPKVMYWSLRNWLVRFCADWGLELDLVEASDPEAIESAVRPGETALIWIETPCNPTWDVVDIASTAAIAHDAGALLAVDSTVATPVHTRPLELGADLVFHAATKSLNGHSDVVAGALVTDDPDAEIWQRIRANRANVGAILGPFEAWLLLRGMRTLYLRVPRASGNAMSIARHFDGHPKVAEVLYPGLETHPGHGIAAMQMQDGFGAMLSLRVNGGRKSALKVLGACKRFVRATSLGGVESLIEHRATIEGQDSPVPDDLLRLSVGIEDIQDLIADLEQALEQA